MKGDDEEGGGVGGSKMRKNTRNKKGMDEMWVSQESENKRKGKNFCSRFVNHKKGTFYNRATCKS